MGSVERNTRAFMAASKKKTAKRSKSIRRRRRRPVWVNWTNEQLLDLRMCQLGLTIEGTQLEGYINQVKKELQRRHLRFCPHFWLSEEWFSPSGISGVALPFYLAHPRLIESA